MNHGNKNLSLKLISAMRATQTGYDVAHTIRDVAFVMQDHGNLSKLHCAQPTPIRDINGNVVGKYEVI